MSNRTAVTADDVEEAVALASDLLGPAPMEDWDRPAGTLEWTCWETVEHMADDLFAYAAQMGPRKPPLSENVPFMYEPRRPGGQANSVFADRDYGPEGLMQVLEACGAMLSAMVQASPPETRAHHCFGNADPEGFAAMGVVEVLVHTHDVAGSLGLEWNPPSDLCARTLARLFPEAPADTEPWPTLLWATGRGDLPGHERRSGRWSWHSAPLSED